MNKTYRYLSVPVLFLLLRVLTLPTVDNGHVANPKNYAYPAWDGACADTINITVNDQCQFTLAPDQLLLGNFSSCPDASVRILVNDLDPSNGGIVDGCGVFQYIVEAVSEGSCGSFTSCWGYVRAEDKTPPVLFSPADDTLTIACEQIDKLKNVEASLDITGHATAQDNCTPAESVDIDFYDQVIYTNDCDTLILERTFTAVDEKDNRTAKKQILTLAAPELADLSIRDTFLLDADCDFSVEVDRDDKGQIHPAVSGYPFYINSLGDTIFISGSHCTLSATYVDEVFTPCASTEKLIRTWIISDWCADEKRILRQVIKFGDVEPPMLACRQDTLFLSTDPFACSASFMLNMPEVTELCGNYEIAVEFYTVSHRGIYGFPTDPDTTLHQSWAFTTANQVLVTDVPIGCHFVQYTVRDECENIATLTCVVCVADEIAPTLSCDDRINLSLDDSGFGKVLAIEVNEGTNDNCGLTSLHVRRAYEADPSTCEANDSTTYSDWEDEVLFSCCDAGSEVVVELRSTDIFGNESTCWGVVFVEDKFKPTCTAPADVTIACDSLPAASKLEQDGTLADLFGTPIVAGNCAADILETDPIIDLDNCGVGTITRQFSALDADGVVRDECTQLITVEPHHDYWIKFPKDYEEFCAEPNPDSVTFSETGCDLMAVSIQDEVLETRSEECYKILRTYRVINWCEYDGEAQPVIVSRDWDAYNGINPQYPDGDDVPGDEDIYVHVKRNLADNQPDTVYYDNNADPYDESVIEGEEVYGHWWRVISGSDDPSEEAYYEGDGSVWSDDGNQTDSDISGNAQRDDNDYRYGSFGFWQYTQHIKVSDAIPPEIFFDDNLVYCVNSDDCSADFDISFAVTDNCVTGGVDINIEVIEGPQEYFDFEENPFSVVGRYPKYLLNGKLPEGEYRIEIEASDRCGNVTRIVFSLDIVDCKAPSPICINGLATELMPVENGEDVDGDGDADLGAMTVWAEDFLASEVIEDCTGPITYSINRKGETPDINQDFLVVTCDDPEFLEIEIHAWDKADNPFNIDDEGIQGGPNHDFCNTYILVQDNMLALCDPTEDDEEGLIIEGVVQTEEERPIPDVNINTNYGNRTNVMTDQNGRYVFDGFDLGGDYSITPGKDDNPKAGVSTFDIVQIGKHILNMKPLGTAYKKIAADVNGSGTITTLDLIQLRKLVLNLENEFPNGKSWRFVPADYQFQTARPEAEGFPETINFNNLMEDYVEAHFIGVKMGDVSGDAMTRSLKDATVRIPNLMIEQGEVVEVPVFLEGGYRNLEGLQFALAMPNKDLQLLGITPGQISHEHFHHDVAGNQLLVSWDQFSNRNRLVEAQPLFWLSLSAKNTTNMEQAGWELNDRVLHSEAYTNNDEWVQINIAFGDQPSANAVIGSFAPNPFIDQTMLKFMLNQPEKVTWTLTDAHGRQIRHWKEDRPAGQQQIILRDYDFNGSGIYYLTLQTQFGVFTSRLVHLW